MFRTQISTFPLHSTASPVLLLYIVDCYTIHPMVQLSLPWQKETSYAFVLFIPKVPTLAVIFVIFPPIYCHSFLDESLPLPSQP